MCFLTKTVPPKCAWAVVEQVDQWQVDLLGCRPWNGFCGWPTPEAFPLRISVRNNYAKSDNSQMHAAFPGSSFPVLKIFQKFVMVAKGFRCTSLVLVKAEILKTSSRKASEDSSCDSF